MFSPKIPKFGVLPEADALWQFLGDLWLFRRDDWSWLPIDPVGGSPGARASHSAVWDVASQALLIYGGQSCTTFYNDVWIFQFRDISWSLLAKSGPSGRAGHSAVWDPRLAAMLVFGGVASEGDNNELWRFSVQLTTWTRLLPDGEVPEPRSEHTALWDEVSEDMLIFGGWSWTSSSPLGDLWRYDSWRRSWICLKSAPESRAGHTAVWDTVSMSMLVHGGVGFSDGLRFEKQTWNYSLLLDNWSPLSLSLPSYGPNARTDHSAAWDPISRSMFIFGGLDSMNETNNEFWRYLGPEVHEVLRAECILGQQCNLQPFLVAFDEGWIILLLGFFGINVAITSKP